MKWYSGSIAEAISLAKGQKATFVAYIEGSCEKSKLMSSVFNDREVCNNLESSRFVVVKLEAGGIGYRQFIEIFKTAPVPSLFFFSYTSIPLDIVSGDLYDEVLELKEAILDATLKCNQLNSSVSPPRTDVSQNEVLEEIRLKIGDILVKRKETREAAAKVQIYPLIGGGEGKKEEKEEVKQTKMAQQNNELKKLAEEREKERQEEAKARQKILEQIAQDKAERAQKMKFVENPTKAEVKSPSASTNGSRPQSSQARIQFRLPTGESKSNMFPNDTRLSQIRDYIDGNFELSYRDYRLATTFPRREFTPEDNGSSLEHLNLVPTAVILILPNTRSSGAISLYPRSLGGMLTNIFQSIFQPIIAFGRYFFFQTREDTRPQNSQEPSQPSTTQSRQSKTVVRKSGNIYSLGDIRDDNDENNTWNGNSTQQM